MFEGALTHTLLDDDDLAALVRDRVRPLQGEADEVRPYVAYQVTGRDDPQPTHDGPSGVTRVTYEIVIVGDTNREVADISAHARRILVAHEGTSNEVDVWTTSFDDETDIEQSRQPGEDKAIYVRVQTYTALYTTGE